jgi:hypothetical protein
VEKVAAGSVEKATARRSSGESGPHAGEGCEAEWGAREMEHGTAGDVARRRMGELCGTEWRRARGMERADGGRAMRRGRERAVGAVISAVWEAASGRLDALFQAFQKKTYPDNLNINVGCTITQKILQA